MTGWAELRSRALVGTTRRPVQGELAAAGRILADRRDAAAVLGAGAVLAVERRAGLRPGHRVPVTSVAPPDARVEADGPAAQLLELILSGTVASGPAAEALLLRWAQRAGSAGRRVPDRLLVDALDVGTSRPPLRKAIAGVVDERGRWLAGLRPSWRWAATPTGHAEDLVDEHDWVRRPSAERVGVLRAVRQVDPGRGRSLVRASWGQDGPADREANLRALAVGLGRDDEPLLEAALQDRSAPVRRAAVELLDALPSSARAGRVAARLRPLIGVRGRVRLRVVVDLPSPSLDPAATADGVADPAAAGGSTPSLHRLVLGAPLAVWGEATGHAVEQLARAVTEPAELVALWIEAAAVQRDPTWAAALLARYADPRLVPVLPAEVAAPLVEGHLRRPLPAEAVLSLVSALDGPWPASLTDALVTNLRRSGPRASWLLGQQVALFLAHAHPGAVRGLERWRASASGSATDRDLRPLIHHLATRQSIDDAFDTGAEP